MSKEKKKSGSSKMLEKVFSKTNKRRNRPSSAKSNSSCSSSGSGNAYMFSTVKLPPISKKTDAKKSTVDLRQKDGKLNCNVGVTIKRRAYKSADDFVNETMLECSQSSQGLVGTKPESDIIVNVSRTGSRVSIASIETAKKEVNGNDITKRRVASSKSKNIFQGRSKQAEAGGSTLPVLFTKMKKALKGERTVLKVTNHEREPQNAYTVDDDSESEMDEIPDIADFDPTTFPGNLLEVPLFSISIKNPIHRQSSRINTVKSVTCSGRGAPVPNQTQELLNHPLRTREQVDEYEVKYAFGEVSEAPQIRRTLMWYKDRIEGGKVITNPHVADKRQTAEAYLMKVLRTQDSAEVQLPNINPNYEYRVRRRIKEGSYKNNTVNENKLPRLLRYVWKEKLIKVKKYLKKRENWPKINNVDEQGRSALHFAASWECHRIMEELLDMPCIDVNVRDLQGKTPLFKAVEIKSLKCVKELMQNGADVDVSCSDGRSPFEFAIQQFGDSEIEIIAEMHKSIRYKESKEETMTHLHQIYLARKSVEVTEVAALLLKSYVDIDAVEGRGRTPLILATKAGRSKLVSILLENWANVLHIDLNGFSAMEYAKKGTEIYYMLREAILRANRFDPVVCKMQVQNNEADISRKAVKEALNKLTGCGGSVKPVPSLYSPLPSISGRAKQY